MKRNLLYIGLLITILLLFSGCAETVDVGKCLPVDGKVYGFWNGLWHGLISWFSFLGSLFSDNISVYAFNNNGEWYNFGFLLGAGSTLSGGCTGGKKVVNKYYYK